MVIVKTIKVKKWYILKHDGGMVEFECTTDPPRSTAIFPDEPPSEIEATLNALPTYVRKRYVEMVEQELDEMEPFQVYICDDWIDGWIPVNTREKEEHREK